MRGCACRGDSAGFVHLACLAKLAESKDVDSASKLGERKDKPGNAKDTAFLNAWMECINCHQNFEGALALEMQRRLWWHCRSRQNLTLCYNSMKMVAEHLGKRGEIDAVNFLYDEASTAAEGDIAIILDTKLSKAKMLSLNGQKLEALELLTSILPEAKKACTGNREMETANRDTWQYETMVYMVDALLNLDRDQEAHKVAVDLVALAKARFGPQHSHAIAAMELYVMTCGKLGRLQESKAMLEEILITKIRIFGPHHPKTQATRNTLQDFHECPPVNFY